MKKVKKHRHRYDRCGALLSIFPKVKKLLKADKINCSSHLVCKCKKKKP